MTIDQSLQSARDILMRAGAIASFSGAGLSAESGVSTFRDAQTDGLWTKLDPMKLASPQGFAEDPNLVMDWYAHRRRQIAASHPNPAHIALAQQADMVHVTQNVDDLLHRAGARDVIQLHGTIAKDRCHARIDYVEDVDLGNPPGLRESPVSPGSYMRPAVVWFGESLPGEAWARADEACRMCDVLLVVGTSAAVYPAAGLISLAKQAGASIIIVNTQASEASHLADVEVLGNAGDIVPKLFSKRGAERA